MRPELRQSIEAHVGWLANKGTPRAKLFGPTVIITFDEIAEVYAQAPIKERADAVVAALEFTFALLKLFTAWLEKTGGRE